MGRHLGIVALLVALAASLVVAPGAAATDGHPAAAMRRGVARQWSAMSCNPVHATGCVLPFPSDVFTRRDPASPTGVRLSVSDDVWPKAMRDQLPAEVAPSRIFGGHDGFSALGPVLFEIDAPFDAATLPDDGGDALAVFDLSSGERVPIHAGLDVQARTHDPAATVIRAWPVGRFDWGHRYVAVLTSALRHQDGSAVPRAESFQRVIDATAAPRWVEYHRPLLDAVAAHGIDETAVVAITGFTVRSREDATGGQQMLTARARADDHPVIDVRAVPLGGPDVGALVTGRVRLTDFRDPDTGGIRWDPDAGHDEWVPFVMTLPSSAAHTPAPVAIYSHGITTVKETMLVAAVPNARRGIATIAIDHPQHGWRGPVEGGYIDLLGRPAQIARLIAIPIQSAIDFVSLVKAVRTSLAGLDIAPTSFATFTGGGGDGRPDLDPDRMVVEGTSMGGVLGLELLALEPHLSAAMFQVPGMGIMSTLTGSVIWTPLHLDGVMPTGATGVDVAAAIAACQFMIDPGDAGNFTDAIQADQRPLAIVYGEGDAIVPNFSTERLIGLTHLPVLDSAGDYAGGSGAYRVPRYPGPAAVTGPMMHLSFTDPGAWAVYLGWLDWLAATSLAPAPPPQP